MGPPPRPLDDDGAGSGTDPHTDASWPLSEQSDVTLKRLFKVVYSSVLGAAAMLLGLFALKMGRDFDRPEETRPVGVFTTIVAALDVAMLAGCVVVFGARLLRAKRSGLAWGRRRRRRTALFCAQMACVLVGNLFFLVPNLYAMANRCRYFNRLHNYAGMIRWSALNTLLALFVVEARTFNLRVDEAGRPVGGDVHASFLDAPWRCHWFLGLYWLLFEACVLSFITFFDGEGSSCGEGPSRCRPTRNVWVVTSHMMAMCFGYVALYLYFMRSAFVRLSKKSHLQHRWAIISVRFNFRMVGIVLLFGVLSMAGLFLARSSSCLSYVVASYGFVPLQFVLTFLMVAATVVAVPPRSGHRMPARDLLSSNFTWLEGRPKGRGPGVPVVGTAFKPLFCFEIAVKLLYWCDLIYEYDYELGQDAPPCTLDAAMALFAFTNFEYIRSPKMDAHGMIAWTDTGTILLCFRGTYSATNVLADLQFWRVPHPTGHGHQWLGTRPLVHKGFLNTWELEGFKAKVLAKVRGIVEGASFDKSRLRLLISGHSLGGAMAILAAHDVVTDCGVPAERLSCYTFGCPHVGNQAFAEEHDRVVPDTWHIVNDVDPISRMGKFFWLFKRSGKRVLVNARGDMVVLPMFLEFKLTSAFMGDRRVKHHLLSSYRKSLSSVVLCQFHKYKAFPGGEEAMRELLENGVATKVLGVSSKSASKLVEMASKVWNRTSASISCDDCDTTGENLGDV